MSEGELAISTLFREVDTLFTRACEGLLVPGAEGSSVRRGRLKSITLKLQGLLEHTQNLDRRLNSLERVQDEPEDDFDNFRAEVIDGPILKGARPAQVEVCPGVQVHAMVLPADCRTTDEVKNAIRGPMLCYVPAWGHFALRMGDLLLHGNVGNIYPATVRRPQGVKECKIPGCVGRNPACTYYHDPATFSAEELEAHAAPIALDASAPLSVRSFFAESFAYCPRAGPQSSRYGMRRLGDVASLPEDIQAMSASEARQFLSQVAHDMVCAAVLAQARPELR